MTRGWCATKKGKLCAPDLASDSKTTAINLACRRYAPNAKTRPGREYDDVWPDMVRNMDFAVVPITMRLAL